MAHWVLWQIGICDCRRAANRNHRDLGHEVDSKLKTCSAAKGKPGFPGFFAFLESSSRKFKIRSSEPPCLIRFVHKLSQVA
jgi:hypothetical protein